MALRPQTRCVVPFFDIVMGHTVLPFSSDCACLLRMARAWCCLVGVLIVLSRWIFLSAEWESDAALVFPFLASYICFRLHHVARAWCDQPRTPHTGWMHRPDTGRAGRLFDLRSSAAGGGSQQGRCGCGVRCGVFFSQLMLKMLRFLHHHLIFAIRNMPDAETLLHLHFTVTTCILILY